jgi:hypothetical protein
MNGLAIGLLQSADTTLRKFGRVGEDIADRIFLYQASMQADVSNLLREFRGITKALSKNDMLHHAIAYLDATEGFKIANFKGETARQVQRLRELFNKVKQDAKLSGILKGVIDDYFPHHHQYNALKGGKKTTEILTKRANSLLNNGKANDFAEAYELARKELESLQMFTKASKKARNIENERLENLPDWLGDPRNYGSRGKYRKDVDQAIERYLLGAYRRVNEEKFFGKYGKQIFGDKYKTWNETLGGLSDDEAKYARRTYAELFGHPEHYKLPEWVNVMRNFTIFEKMDLSAIANTFQSLVTTLPKATTFGYIRGVRILSKGLKEAVSSSGKEFADRYGATLSQTVKNLSNTQVGENIVSFIRWLILY